MVQNIINSLLAAKDGLDLLLKNQDTIFNINQAAQIIINTFENTGTIFSCGNGGSMSDAIHFAEELTGRYRKNRKALPAIAICDPGHLTCVGNDYGFEFIFSRYLEAHGRLGDCLIAISTSGSSKNILEVTKYAKANGIKVIGLTGKANSLLAQQADLSICTPAGEFADRVQELHIKVLHIIIELIERHFFPENYIL